MPAYFYKSKGQWVVDIPGEPNRYYPTYAGLMMYWKAKIGNGKKEMPAPPRPHVNIETLTEAHPDVIEVSDLPKSSDPD